MLQIQQISTANSCSFILQQKYFVSYSLLKLPKQPNMQSSLEGKIIRNSTVQELIFAFLFICSVSTFSGIWLLYIPYIISVYSPRNGQSFMGMFRRLPYYPSQMNYNPSDHTVSLLYSSFPCLFPLYTFSKFP